ncbi:MAG TPA: LysR family transcriptional regulator [Candidatus Gemmiger excrementigallinarum]|uniref:LysR family transcriptional regulator n=1 Tax=Candidatus Gemmiger excrementigallinarum TaxID=2838609 RepID=A0A9D2ET07_9FIRM|nr:LysR family transcriptional regulator [Candidatus Gemmiger excrementigallinarum]
MNTQQLMCFVCVADRLNFTKAAEELFLSPPTVTHHIQTLEAELGTPLLIRNSKMVRLTEAGRGFYNDAREILAKIEIAQKKMHDAAHTAVRLFHIGCTSSTELQYLKPPLRALERQHPGFNPIVHMQDYFSLKKMFEAEQLDIMLCTRDMIHKLHNCEFHPVAEAGLYAVVAADSPLANKPTLHFADLQDQRLLTLHPKQVPFESSSRLRDWIIDHGLNHMDIHCESDRSGILLAECGYGVALFPEFYTQDLPDTLVRRPFEPDMGALTFGVACRKQGKDQYVKEFLAEFPTQR